MTLNNLKLNRVLVCKMFALFFGLALLPLYSNGQSWETVRSENFNGVTNSFSVIPDFTQVGFSPFPGQARSVLNNNFIYAAFQAQLDPTYEYRFSWNIKGNSSGKKVVFKLGTASGTTGTDVSGVFSLSNTFVVRQSNAFTVPQNGNYFLIATPPPSGYSAALLQVYFDDFLLERRALPMPELSFELPEITLSELNSGPTQICVQITNTTFACTAEVALAGSANPHLSSFTTQSLSFPAGSMAPQCFTLQLEPANGEPDLNLTYALELQNLTGGAVAGEISTITVTVTDDQALLPGCPWAGEDKTICAAEPGEGTIIGCPEMSGTEGFCYSWLPKTGLSSPHSAMTPANPMETTTYTLYVTDSEGNLQAMEQVKVTVLPIPELAITPNSTIICTNQSITLQATEGFTSYAWSTNETTDNIVISSPGTYSVTATENHILSVDEQLNCTNTAEAVISDASNDQEAVAAYFSEKGFYCIPIPVNVLGPEALTGQPGDGLPRDLCADASCSGSTTPCVQDHANVAIAIGSEELPNLEDAILENLDFFATTFGYEAPKGFITTSLDVCNCPGYLDGINAQFEAAELSFWVHVWDNPSTETDQLCILTNVPSSDAHYPDSEAHRNELDAILEETIANSDMAEFESNAEQAVYALMFNLLDNSITFYTGIDSPPQDYYPCGGTTSTNTVCVTPAGIPVLMPSGTTLSFSHLPEVDYIPVGSLTGFLYNGEIFTGRSRIYQSGFTEIVGYFSSSSIDPFTSFGEPIANSPVILGYMYPSAISPVQECTKISLEKVVNFTPFNPWNPGGAGALDPSFHDNYSLFSSPGIVEEYYIHCNNITFQQVSHPKKVIRRNDSQWEAFLPIVDANNETYTARVYCTLEADGTFTYHIFDCPSGQWLLLDPVRLPPYAEGLGQLMLTGTIFATGVLLVEFGIFYPGVGIILDVASAYIAFTINDYLDGTISTASALLGAGGFVVTLESGKYILQTADALEDVSHLTIKTPEGNVFGLTEEQIGNSLEILRVEQVGTKTLTRVFNRIIEGDDIAEELANLVRQANPNTVTALKILDELYGNLPTTERLLNIGVIRGATDLLDLGYHREQVKRLVFVETFGATRAIEAAKNFRAPTYLADHSVAEYIITTAFGTIKTVENMDIPLAIERIAAGPGTFTNLPQLKTEIQAYLSPNTKIGVLPVIEDAGRRASMGGTLAIENGNADLEHIFALPATGGESMQFKLIIGNAYFDPKLKDACKQLRGETNEIPAFPDGTVAHIKITNSSNPFGMTNSADLLTALRGYHISGDVNFTGVKKVVIENLQPPFIHTFDVITQIIN